MTKHPCQLCYLITLEIWPNLSTCLIPNLTILKSLYISYPWATQRYLSTITLDTICHWFIALLFSLDYAAVSVIYVEILSPPPSRSVICVTWLTRHINKLFTVSHLKWYMMSERTRKYSPHYAIKLTFQKKKKRTEYSHQFCFHV